DGSADAARDTSSTDGAGAKDVVIPDANSESDGSADADGSPATDGGAPDAAAEAEAGDAGTPDAVQDAPHDAPSEPVPDAPADATRAAPLADAHADASVTCMGPAPTVVFTGLNEPLGLALYNGTFFLTNSYDGVTDSVLSIPQAGLPDGGTPTIIASN